MQQRTAQVDAILRWLEATPLALAIAESETLFPWIECVHVLAITLVVGSIAIVDLRRIGFASRSHAVNRLTRDVLPLTWIAFAAGCGTCQDALLKANMPPWMLVTHNSMQILFTPGRVTLLGESDGAACAASMPTAPAPRRSRSDFQRAFDRQVCAGQRAASGLWVIELTSPGNLVRSGWTRTAVKPRVMRQRRRANCQGLRMKTFLRSTRKIRPLAFVAALALSACGETAHLPLAAGIGPSPTLPPPNHTLIPTVHIAPAKGWPEGGTPTSARRHRGVRFRFGPRASALALRAPQWRCAGRRDQCAAQARGR